MTDDTIADIKRGWAPLACGCHAYVFRASAAINVPAAAFEYCQKSGLYGVRIDALMDGKKRDEYEYAKGGFLTPEDPRLVGEIPEEFCIKRRKETYDERRKI